LEEKKKVKRYATGYHDTKNTKDWKEVFDYLIQDVVQVPYSHKPHDMELDFQKLVATISSTF
jgi:hypothetical protein